MKNLEASEVVIGKILTLLMDWGIRPTKMKFEELELDEEYQAYFLSCLEWLQDEGLIRVHEIVRDLEEGGGFAMHPVLTAQGLAVLGRQVSTGTDAGTIANAVREVADTKRSYSQVRVYRRYAWCSDKNIEFIEPC